jgi:hypothetical protein
LHFSPRSSSSPPRLRAAASPAAAAGGANDLTLSFTTRAFGEFVGSTSPVLETCAAHFFVTAR